MVTSTQLQNKYIKLYECIRNYIWSYEVIDSLADLEIETFKALPDIMVVKAILDRLHVQTRNICKEDEDLECAFDEFEEILENDTEVCYTITQVNEVI